MGFKEDKRALREFYPDSNQRHRVHYGFAHQFLPPYVHRDPNLFFSYLLRRDMPGGPMEPNRFIHSRWIMFEEAAKLVPGGCDPSRSDFVFRRVSDLSLSMIDLGSRPAVLVQMPSPEQVAEAFYVAAVLLSESRRPESWPPDVPARVFTLEEMFPDNSNPIRRGVLCEWTKEGQHRNLGMGVPFERDAFLRAVASALQSPERPAAGTFTPPQGVA